jgi:hypothetical protein
MGIALLPFALLSLVLSYVILSGLHVTVKEPEQYVCAEFVPDEDGKLDMEQKNLFIGRALNSDAKRTKRLSVS